MDWLYKAWRFLENETNHKTLAFIGGGIVAVVIGGWQFYTHFAPSGTFEQARSGPSRPAGVAWPAAETSISRSSPDLNAAAPASFQGLGEARARGPGSFCAPRQAL